ncbi:MAG: hypothetical protein JO251_00250 [Verrucomicrobia bacterium]|nr:hypothetical protein [Verrucomicrobiota bacterium]
MDHVLTFEDLLDDPLIRLVRASDRVTDGEFLSLMRTIRQALLDRKVGFAGRADATPTCSPGT